MMRPKPAAFIAGSTAFAHTKRATNVHRNHVVEVVSRHIRDTQEARRHDTRTVHENRDGAQSRLNLRHYALDLGLLDDVRAKADMRASRSFPDLAGRRRCELAV